MLKWRSEWNYGYNNRSGGIWKALQLVKNIQTNDFGEALFDARELTEDLDVEAGLKNENKRVRKERRLFDYEVADEPLSDPEETSKVQFFNQMVDKALQTHKPLFQQLTKHYELFGKSVQFSRYVQRNYKKMCCKFGKDLDSFQISPYSRKGHDNENCCYWCFHALWRNWSNKANYPSRSVT